MKLKDLLSEKIIIDIELGDVILTGKFKNKKEVVKKIGVDDHGMPTINGRKAATFRIKSRVNIFDEENLNESPDWIDVEGGQRVEFDRGGYPFGWHNKEAYVGIKNITHGNNMFTKNGDVQYNFDRPDWDYAGRVWPEYKIMSFWEYPTPSQLTKMIKELNAAFKANDAPFKIDVNKWSIEVVKDKSGKWKKGFIGSVDGTDYDWDQDQFGSANDNYDSYWDHPDFSDYTNAIIPMTKFTGSAKRSAADKGKAHLLSPLVKKMDKVRKQQLARMDKARTKKGHVTAKQKAMATKYKFSEDMDD